MPDALQSLHLGGFIAGQHLGQHPLDAHLLRNRLGCALVIAGDHHHLQPKLAQLGNRLARAGLHRIGHRHQTKQPGWIFTLSRPSRHDHGGLALGLQPGDLLSQRFDGNAFVLHHARVADDERLVFHRGADAKTADRPEIGRVHQCAGLSPCAASTMARPSGCSEPRSALAARRNTSSAV